ncbi:hypothetical protein [Marinifilum flexuosum]|uniref:hypothetical protein n=1 Tax=Marinifilum flexuosum TaxID=1117708 RepID=UPI00248F6F65|nr:hypothetical protein [Marinifilum flexuosum]
MEFIVTIVIIFGVFIGGALLILQIGDWIRKNKENRRIMKKVDREIELNPEKIAAVMNHYGMNNSSKLEPKKNGVYYSRVVSKSVNNDEIEMYYMFFFSDSHVCTIIAPHRPDKGIIKESLRFLHSSEEKPRNIVKYTVYDNRIRFRIKAENGVYFHFTGEILNNSLILDCKTQTSHVFECEEFEFIQSQKQEEKSAEVEAKPDNKLHSNGVYVADDEDGFYYIVLTSNNKLFWHSSGESEGNISEWVYNQAENFEDSPHINKFDEFWVQDNDITCDYYTPEEFSSRYVFSGQILEDGVVLSFKAYHHDSREENLVFEDLYFHFHQIW